MEVIEISLTGRILKSRYCILEKIAGGGEGDVYLARDMELGTLWAVKELPLEKKKEAKLLRLLNHPGLPKMIDYLEKEENCYLVMEYIQGKNLEEWIRGKNFLSLEEILKIGIETAGILKYLHSGNPPVFYGDLKPGNLMMTESGRIYLIDFGSAVFGYREKQNMCLGTKGYAAPEQYKGRVTALSDIYALGKTIYALVEKRKLCRFIKCPELFFAIKKCCRQKESLRFQSAEETEKKFTCILNNIKTGRIKGFYAIAGAFAVMCLSAAIVIPLLSSETEADFSRALSKVTEVYYKRDFAEAAEEEKREICEETEKKLQKLLHSYKKEKEQRRLLLLLAVNEEYQKDTERAEDYYRQLLLYEPEYREAYTEYGMFLWKKGDMEKSRKLLKEFKEKEEKGMLEGVSTENEKVWKERLYEEKE